jgi:hypothetical protein
MNQAPFDEPCKTRAHYPCVSFKTLAKSLDTRDNIVGALVGLETSKVREFISDAVPGFADHYGE